MKDKLLCYPKINLGLNIFDINKDANKHSLESIFLLYINSIYYDLIEISESQTTKVSYDGYEINDCIIVKTILYLKKNKIIDESLNFDINVIKKIPIGSGLGGESANAASIIKYLQSHNLLNKSIDLYDVAKNLGSDIPFFISNLDSVIVSGIGDILKPINIKTKLDIKIMYPNIPISTKDIFNKFEFLKNNKKLNNFNKIINNINDNIVPTTIYNDLESSIFNLNTNLQKIFEDSKNENDLVTISGSGSTLVMINKDKKVRTRYAPSPTGFFHIGGARTAIFNYLFAKHYNGDFIVRIEDTDTNRNVVGGIESQLSNLSWMKITPDESISNPGKFGPYIQSKKFNRYKDLAHSLLLNGHAYYCFCSQEQLELDRENALNNHQTPKYNRRCIHLSKDEIDENLKNNVPYVIRLKINDNQNYGWNDLIRGKIEVPSSAMTDPVILKSNGIAMYNFAVVIDDFDMDITHVLRGEEHISNTPYQIAIRDALGFNNGIQYGHLSVIIDETGKKLSKRNKSLKQFVEDYKLLGFIPESIDNFLALLGWSPNDNKEILSMQEMINNFDINNISKSPTFFDFKKLLWIGNEYFKKMDNDKYINFVSSYIEDKNLNYWLKSNIESIILLFKNQISYASQLNDLIKEHFIDSHSLNDDDITIVKNNMDVILLFKDLIQSISSFNEEKIIDIINDVKVKTDKKGKDLFMPIRLCSTNMSHGPELAKMIYFTGHKKVIENIENILKKGE